MNSRDAKIIKAALDFLHEREAQLTDMTIHDEVRARVSPPPAFEEYEAAMQIASTSRWVITVPARFGSGFRRSISQEGEAARLEMGR